MDELSAHAAADPGDDGAIDVTVLVCTRDRCDALGRLLERLTQIDIPPGLRWEVIVVDNGSSDRTPAVLAARRGVLPLRVIDEPIAGTSRGRNRGLAAARGALVMLTDDDCLPDRQWLAAAWREFTSDPALDVVAGRVELHDARDRAVSIRPFRERLPIDRPQRLSLIMGCNLGFRRRTIDILGGFDIALGAGTPAAAGEDVDYLYRALVAGLTIVYSPDVLVYHDHGRRTDAQVRQVVRAYSVARGALFGKYVALPARGRGMRARAYADLVFHARQAARDVAARRWPRTALRHYRYLARGLLYWIGHRIAPWPERQARRRQPGGAGGP